MRASLPSSTTLLKQRGFSMLEILITLVIIATALLGTASLQIHAIRMNQSSEFRTQAVFLASDIAERMEANKTAALAGDYKVSQNNIPSTATTDCSGGSCDSTKLAAWDISQWETSIITLGLPQASWQITQPAGAAVNNLTTYKVVINWTDRSSDKSTHSENFSYTAVRTVSQ